MKSSKKQKEDFFKPKIIYAEIVQEPRFYLDNEGRFMPEATIFLMTGKYLPYLYNLFNSKTITFLFKTYYAGGGLGESGYRYKKAFFENLPIPPYANTTIQKKIYNADEDSNIEPFIYKLYGFTDTEIEFIEKIKDSSSEY